MRTRCNHQKGQSLAVAVVGLMLAAFCFTLLAQAGRLCLERQRADNAADAVALGTAVDYARALNFISLTNKIYALTEIAQILKMIPWTMPFVLWVPPAKTMQRIQDYLAGTGSSLGYGSARLNLGILGELAGMNLAQANGLQAVILWNGDENESPSLIPSLNLKRRCSDDAAPDQDSSQGQSQGNGQGSQRKSQHGNAFRSQRKPDRPRQHSFLLAFALCLCGCLCLCLCLCLFGAVCRFLCHSRLQKFLAFVHFLG